MGARCTFVFKQSEDLAVALYSHWGEDTWRHDLAIALEHARPRWHDDSYFTRMVISKLIEGDITGETGYGIWALTPETLEGAYMDTPVVIDMVNRTIEGHSWESFITYEEELFQHHDFSQV